MTFHIGQKVICITPTLLERYLVKGRIYTVCENGLQHSPTGESCITLFEVASPYQFWEARFRPVVERKTDISIFTAMLVEHKADA